MESQIFTKKKKSRKVGRSSHLLGTPVQDSRKHPKRQDDKQEQEHVRLRFNGDLIRTHSSLKDTTAGYLESGKDMIDQDRSLLLP